VNNYYNPDYYPNDYYDPYRQHGTGVYHYQPVGAGSEWVNRNVDIMMNNGTCFSNVRFLSVDPVTNPSGTTEYVWTFELYGGGGAPVRRRVSPQDVAEINQPGTLCQQGGGQGGWQGGGHGGGHGGWQGGGHGGWRGV
jgi:hypothetical protein